MQELVIASEAKQSKIPYLVDFMGLLRRCAPRKDVAPDSYETIRLHRVDRKTRLCQRGFFGPGTKIAYYPKGHDQQNWL